jgi:tetratricopeptide (TPR) repeat protein
MINITYLLLSLFLFSCASSSKNEKVDLDDISNEDFKKQKAVAYNANRDFFKGVDSKYSSALNDEGIQRVKKFGGEIDSKDVITSIIMNCYEGEYEDAQEIIRENQEAYRSNPAFWNQVGTCYLLQKERRKALLFYNKALEFDTNYSPALNNLGVLYRKFGEDQKAEVAFKRAIKGNNFAKTPRFNLAQLYLTYGLYKFAIKELNVLDRVSKGDVDVLVGIGTAHLMSGNPKLALKYFNKIESSFYERPYIGLNISYANYLAGKKEVARDIFSDVDSSKLGRLKDYYKMLKRNIE